MSAAIGAAIDSPVVVAGIATEVALRGVIIDGSSVVPPTVPAYVPTLTCTDGVPADSWIAKLTWVTWNTFVIAKSDSANARYHVLSDVVPSMLLPQATEFAEAIVLFTVSVSVTVTMPCGA